MTTSRNNTGDQVHAGNKRRNRTIRQPTVYTISRNETRYSDAGPTPKMGSQSSVPIALESEHNGNRAAQDKSKEPTNQLVKIKKEEQPRRSVKRTAAGQRKIYFFESSSDSEAGYTSSDDISDTIETDYEIDTNDDDLRNEFEPVGFKTQLQKICQRFGTSLVSTSTSEAEDSDVVLPERLPQRLPYQALHVRNKLVLDPANRHGPHSSLDKIGSVFHTDFTEAEVSLLSLAAESLGWLVDKTDIMPDQTVAASLLCAAKRAAYRNTTSLSAVFQTLAKHAATSFNGERRPEDIVQFLQDIQTEAEYGNLPQDRRHRSSRREFAHLRLLRELNTGSFRGQQCCPVASCMAIRDHVFSQVRHVGSWTGGSGDVMSIAWSMDGRYVAAGCSAITDQLNLSYNCPNNLLFGRYEDLHANKVLLGNSAHKLTGPPGQGWIFQPVPIVKFSTQHNILFSGSHDKKLMAWNFDHVMGDNDPQINKPGPENPCWQQAFGSAVEDLDISQDGSLLAVATHDYGCQVRTYRLEGENPMRGISATSVYASKEGLYPSSLKFGKHTPHHLLVGYTIADSEAKIGDLAIYDVTSGHAIEVLPRTLSVFDVIWHSTRPLFAAATVAIPDAKTTTQTKSFVRLWDYAKQNPKQKLMELDCVASDINDLRWGLDHQVTASCTDGKTYVWDIRKPQEVLYSLCHGPPLVELPHDLQRERWDTGVRFTSFHRSNPYHLYTGSSDGIVKKWDLRLSQENVHIDDVCDIQHQIISGAYSPDGGDLLLGDDTGKLHLYGADPDTFEETVLAAEPLLVSGQDNEANVAIMNN